MGCALVAVLEFGTVRTVPEYSAVAMDPVGTFSPSRRIKDGSVIKKCYSYT